MRPANERLSYIVTLSLIGWAYSHRIIEYGIEEYISFIIESGNCLFLRGIISLSLFVVVNFDALAQASDIQIERRQVVFLC